MNAAVHKPLSDDEWTRRTIEGIESAVHALEDTAELRPEAATAGVLHAQARLLRMLYEPETSDQAARREAYAAKKETLARRELQPLYWHRKEGPEGPRLFAQFGWGWAAGSPWGRVMSDDWHWTADELVPDEAIAGAEGISGEEAARIILRGPPGKLAFFQAIAALIHVTPHEPLYAAARTMVDQLVATVGAPPEEYAGPLTYMARIVAIDPHAWMDARAVLPTLQGDLSIQELGSWIELTVRGVLATGWTLSVDAVDDDMAVALLTPPYGPSTGAAWIGPRVALEIAMREVTKE